MAKSEVIEVLRIFINLLNSEGICIDKAFLYGSYLNDTAGTCITKDSSYCAAEGCTFTYSGEPPSRK